MDAGKGAGRVHVETISDDADELPYGGLDESLLANLAMVREALAAGSGEVPVDVRRRCLGAVEEAMVSAAEMERLIVRQRMHIADMTRIACTDPLTNVYNRRGFDQEFNRVLAAATRFDETGVLVYVDLDGFKPINDTYGHAAGDAVLAEVARALEEHVRQQDLVARIGGDEFAVLLTRTDWESGLKRAEAIKQLLNNMYVEWNGKNIAVRASLGFQRYGSNAEAELLLSAADEAMFKAKRMLAQNAETAPADDVSLSAPPVMDLDRDRNLNPDTDR